MCVGHGIIAISSKNFFFQKKPRFWPKMQFQPRDFKAASSHQYWSLEHPQCMKMCLRSLRSPKKVFWRSFDAFRHHFEHFEFWSKNQNFPIFRPKNAWKIASGAPFKRKKRYKNAFQVLKIFIFWSEALFFWIFSENLQNYM